MGTEKKRSTNSKQSRKKSPSRNKRESTPLNERLSYSTENFLNDLECAREMFEVIVPTLKKQDDTRKKKIDKILE